MSSKIRLMEHVERPRRGFARSAILSATIEVIARHGLDAVTHRRVAELAGVSPGSTTHHFATREDLIVEAFRFYIRHADRVIDAIDQRVRSDHDDPRTRIVELLCQIVQREFEDARLVRAEYEMLLKASEHEELATLARSWEARWVVLLAEHLEAAGWSAPVEVARLLVNVLRGFELDRLVNPQLDANVLRQRLVPLLGGRSG